MNPEYELSWVYVEEPVEIIAKAKRVHLLRHYVGAYITGVRESTIPDEPIFTMARDVNGVRIKSFEITDDQNT